MYIIVICVFVICSILETNGADHISPCPHILKYEELKANDRWQGVLELRDQEGLEGIWLNLVLDSKADILINSFGETTTLNNKHFAINKPGYILLPGAVLKIRFTVKYNADLPVPNVVSIRLNGVEICANAVINAPSVSPSTVTPNPTSKDPDIDIRITNRDGVCGIKTQARPLVYNGQIAEGHWPWHIAIMMLLRDSKVDYHCGGSLISENYVLTAAHCVTILSTRKLIDNDMFGLYIGTTELSDPQRAFKVRSVADIIIHNEYNPTRYHNDLAVIKLREPVEFNDFIRPVCLWDGDTQIRDLIGQVGTVVGWGIDNSNKTATNLMEAKLPIVGLETCLYHDRNFFSQYTSPSTFCAGGGGNDTAVCSGDSGGGMVFPKSGTSGRDQIWQIRGLVSVSPRDTDSVCNTKSYVVFTDIVPHIPWIKEAANLN